MPPLLSKTHIPLGASSNVNLDISGVAGFFGGDVAVSAMATATIYKGRRWLGWYNSPGSYEIAKRYGRLARSRFWCGLYPGTTEEPAVLFELDGMDGPRYCAVQSGTVMNKTGHLGYLFLQECKALDCRDWQMSRGEKARETSFTEVTIATLKHVPAVQDRPRNAVFSKSSLVSIIPILASVMATVLCAVVEDWYCFCVILLGMLCSGVSCFVIGSGEFTFTHPDPAAGSPPGDGILDEGDQIIVLQGCEGAVNPITRGRFSLVYKSGPNHHTIGMSSILLTIQFLTQLLLVPQGTNFGQIMFLTSLGVSWIYNSYLSSLDKVSIQRRILVDDVLQKPQLRKYKLGTRTSTTVFVLLVLSRHGNARRSIEPILHNLLPNKTPMWNALKCRLLDEIEAYREDSRKRPIFAPTSNDRKEFVQNDMQLIETLYGDARAALAAFEAYASDLEDMNQEEGLPYEETVSYEPKLPPSERSTMDSVRKKPCDDL